MSVSKLAFWNHERMYWVASVLLALFVGMGIMQGVANQWVWDTSAKECHDTLQQDLKHLKPNPIRLGKSS